MSEFLDSAAGHSRVSPAFVIPRRDLAGCVTEPWTSEAASNDHDHSYRGLLEELQDVYLQCYQLDEAPRFVHPRQPGRSSSCLHANTSLADDVFVPADNVSGVRSAAGVHFGARGVLKSVRR